MKQNYDLLILGATALAAGIAEANRGLDILIVERGCLCAAEFSQALRTGAAHEPVSPQANALLDEFKRRGAIGSDGKEWLPAISPIIAEHLRDSGADCVFFAALSRLESADGRYSAAFTAYGIETSFTAKRIIDTTADFVSHSFFGLPAPKLDWKLNYLTADENKNITLRSIPCPDGDVAAARLSLLEGDRNDRLLYVGGEPDKTPLEPDNAVWVPSARSVDYLGAFDRGARLALPSCQLSAAVPEPIDDGGYDIIAVGLGTAGAVAAITAAGEGMRVLGIESLYMPGGSGTAGAIQGYYFGFKGGLYRKIDELAHSYDSKFLRTGGVGFGQKILALDQSALAEGVECKYGAQFVKALRQGGRVTGVRYIYNGEIHEASAKFVIDCTAENSVCVNAGCATQNGRQSDGRYQPYSSVMLRTDGASVGYGYIDDGAVDQYDPDDFGLNILKSSTSYLHLRDSYARQDYLGIVPLIGLREGRKIVGEENLSFKAMIEGGFCENPVYYGFSNLDNHGKDSALENRAYQDWITICGLWGWGMAIPVPMGALIPKDTDGLLTAGRGVAVDHTLATGLRMKDDCQKSGESAARLAVLAIRGNIPAREVDVKVLREQLFATGCLKPEDRVIVERQHSDERYDLPLWCADDDKLRDGLAGDAPGYYIWSAKASGKYELMKALLGSDEPQTRWHAALSLSLFDDLPESDRDRLIDVLCECALSRDGFIPQNGRKYINLRSVSAICALGRLGSARAIPTLYSLIDSLADTVAAIPFEPYDLISDRGDLGFQYASHLITSLCDIARANPDRRPEIKAKLAGFADGRRFETTMMGTVGFKLDCTPTLLNLIAAL